VEDETSVLLSKVCLFVSSAS